MFKTISPLNHSPHKDLISSFLQSIIETPNLGQSFNEHQDATFFVTHGETCISYGGALLLKKKVSSFQRTFSTQKTSLSLKTDEVWACTVRLHIDNSMIDFESFGKIFYHNLYEKLVEFGATVGADFLYMVLDPGEYLCTEAIGFWPYVAEVRPQESMDGLFHGILSLSKGHSPIREKNINVSSSGSLKLAA